ncbi:hypothetical protein SSX86_021861 [Deinandra increscens subsp. villosa]|uniref:Pectinesterase inhibitor domain-containing protein n=1 Tax=Deinandra increscens subsp. villosa TaxID=3103831 RepID=A0AAP0CS89_9ASTR
MVKLEYFYLLVLLLTTHQSIITAANPATMNYINASCRNTRYPALCVRCLSRYASSIQGNDLELAKAAISVTLNNAKSTADYVSKLAGSSGLKPSAYQTLKDCNNNMNNCVQSLSQSVQELAKMGQFRGQNFEWHMSNVETWVSSALTNQNTCSRGFSDGSMDGPVKEGVTRRMNYLAPLTSNALALINRFALRHKPRTHTP